MWAGWASKTVADHMGVGCKTGHPYIKHNKASNPFVNLMKEYKGLEWQEEVIRFFDTVQLSEASRSDAGDAYIDLSWHVHTKLGHLNPYFQRYVPRWCFPCGCHCRVNAVERSRGDQSQSVHRSEEWMDRIVSVMISFTLELPAKVSGLC